MMISRVPIEQAKAIWNADFLAAIGFSREINSGKLAPRAAPGIRKTWDSTITVVQASTILPTSPARPGYHASSARKISIGFRIGGLNSPYLVMTDLNAQHWKVAS